MFGSKAISLPSPFPNEHRTQRLYTESARPQPIGQCHFLVVHPGSREQRCPCQGYQQNHTTAGSVCDCAHAACYHAQSVQNDILMSQDDSIGNANQISNLLDRIRKLEEALRTERRLRESELSKEQNRCDRQIKGLHEALTPFYKSEQEMQHKLTEIEDKLDELVNEQTRMRVKVAGIEDASVTPRGRMQSHATNSMSADHRAKSGSKSIGPHDIPGVYSGSEGRNSVSVEPMSPKQSATIIPMEPESPRSSGILNLVELPRPVLPRHTMPPRLSPPLESEEPRSSGFLALDVKELIVRRRIASSYQPVNAYSSPASSATKSPPKMVGRNLTPQSLPRTSPPHVHINGHMTDLEDRAYKKRKHHAELMALDVLADVSAASPVMS